VRIPRQARTASYHNPAPPRVRPGASQFGLVRSRSPGLDGARPGLRVDGQQCSRCRRRSEEGAAQRGVQLPGTTRAIAANVRGSAHRSMTPLAPTFSVPLPTTRPPPRGTAGPSPSNEDRTPSTERPSRSICPPIRVFSSAGPGTARAFSLPHDTTGWYGSKERGFGKPIGPHQVPSRPAANTRRSRRLAGRRPTGSSPSPSETIMLLSGEPGSPEPRCALPHSGPGPGPAFRVVSRGLRRRDRATSGR
jgi:hypothetical protein